MGREGTRAEPDRNGSGTRSRNGIWPILSLRSTIGVVVTFVWSVSFLADIFLPHYDPDATIHVVMMIVAGGLFGQQIVEKARNGG